jgi:hypothetical protein
MPAAADTVSEDEADFATTWHSVFFVLYCFVMSVSLVFYLCLLRAIATFGRKETVVYFALIFLFFTSLVEDAVVVQQFIMAHVETAKTTSLCQLFAYVVFGNRILQAEITVALAFYAWFAIEKKVAAVEKSGTHYFPAVVIALLLLELIISIWPAMNVAGSEDSGQFCHLLDQDYARQRRTGWLYLVIFPYLLPLLLCAFPCIRLGLKLRAGATVEPNTSLAKISLVVAVSYFFFHLLYYLLMLGREIEALMLDRPAWRKVLGMHVWYITRPMFALIAYGWHIVVPLAPFAFDEDLRAVFPGSWMNRRRLEGEENTRRNTMAQIEAVKEVSLREGHDPNGNRFQNPLHFMSEASEAEVISEIRLDDTPV